MTPEQTAIVTACHIKGIPQGEIAERIGVTRETVNRNLNRPEIRALIEREAQEIINRGLKPARRTLTRLAAIGNNKGADKDMLKLSLDASKHITSMAGLSGTQPSTVINALIQVNEAPQVSREIEGLAQYLQSQWMDNKYPEARGVDTKDTVQITGIEAPRTPQTDEVVDLPAPSGSDRDGSGQGV